FEIYDQDEDDATPFDDKADYYAQGVGTIVKHLTDAKHRRAVAAWNGLFFAYSRPGGGPGVIAHHIGPVVLGGDARYNVGNHRWTFGVKVRGERSTFEARYLPRFAELPGEFDFGASGAQMLIR